MTGLKYYRIQKNLSSEELAKLTGYTVGSIRLYEKMAAEGRGRSSLWIAFSDVLGVPVQELLRCDLPEIIDRKNRRTIRWSKTANSNNPITIYYRVHRLSYYELAQRLGNTTRECGRVVCSAPKASPKHIKALARYEGVSEQAFLRKYSPQMNNKVKEG